VLVDHVASLTGPGQPASQRFLAEKHGVDRRTALSTTSPRCVEPVGQIRQKDRRDPTAGERFTDPVGPGVRAGAAQFRTYVEQRPYGGSEEVVWVAEAPGGLSAWRRVEDQRRVRSEPL
jgi:hypothetical protein